VRWRAGRACRSSAAPAALRRSCPCRSALSQRSAPVFTCCALRIAACVCVGTRKQGERGRVRRVHTHSGAACASQPEAGTARDAPCWHVLGVVSLLAVGALSALHSPGSPRALRRGERARVGRTGHVSNAANAHVPPGIATRSPGDGLPRNVTAPIGTTRARKQNAWRRVAARTSANSRQRGHAAREAAARVGSHELCMCHAAKATPCARRACSQPW
jgi:hypothetical protein